MAPGDGKPHIATVDRVGTSTEHVCASSFSSRTLSTLGLESRQAVFQTGVREGYPKGYENRPFAAR